MNVKGRDFKTGMPKVITLTSTEIFRSFTVRRMITDEVLAVLEQTSPELVSDISENGITLTGGCSQIWGMDLLIAERTEAWLRSGGRPRRLHGLRRGQEPCMDQSHAGRPHQHCQKTGDAWLIWRKKRGSGEAPC